MDIKMFKTCTYLSTMYTLCGNGFKIAFVTLILKGHINLFEMGDLKNHYKILLEEEFGIGVYM